MPRPTDETTGTQKKQRDPASEHGSLTNENSDERALKDNWVDAGEAQANTCDPATLPDDLSLAAACSLFWRTLVGQSKQTLRSYKVGCRTFMYYVNQSGRGDPTTVPVRDLPPLVLESYYLWLVERYGRGKRATLTTYMAGPRNLFAYLARHSLTPGGAQYAHMVGGLAKLAGRSSYKTPRIDYDATRELARYMYALTQPDESGAERWPPDLYAAGRTLSEAEKKLRRLEVLRDRALILTLHVTGMRREEASNLNRADVREGRNDEALITGKGDKEGVVFFDQATLDAIRAYLAARADTYAPLFIQHGVGLGQPGPRGENFRLSPTGVWRAVQRWAKVCGLKVKPHDFRHALATQLLNDGAPLSLVQETLRHNSPATTRQIYAQYEKKTVKTALAQYRRSVDKR